MDIELHDSLDGQVALVTGASRGIGRAIADGLVERGATVYAGARNPDDVEADDRHAVRLDVTDEADIGAAIDRIKRETERLDILVNNAAVAGPDGPIGEGTTGGIDRVLATNLRGPILTSKHALPLLLTRDGGRIVNVSSTGGQLSTEADRWRGVYSLSKTGLNGLTIQLAAAYADDGLLVNSASPGWTRTDLGGPEAPRSPKEGADTPVWLARFTAGSPSGKFWEGREQLDWYGSLGQPTVRVFPSRTLEATAPHERCLSSRVLTAYTASERCGRIFVSRVFATVCAIRRGYLT